ncbi:hypothetical protein D2962_12880 [Biomaibacter acetigenes]|uniref:Polymer-forming cytoskeletal protein n=1 Tax=Biomaibacter acetigenes TaxID=2316383 RepID=A0A3G2R7B8_9FIRM|nr:polymer-forming cytoskeletal protein [Biomaibacter acetigenes]AYO31372.1 hypothetical protein D2962_12880 [Biomaibacter acetigenes]MDN5313600.1 Polymer-forming cytoskeletal [Thermoanaerobacteraceae bacterium]RKL63307.1 hypothetical protein DXT63_06900 [Thermoanaerobacteraceae bacterium SP2]
MSRNILELFNNLLNPEAQPRESCGHMEISGAFTGDICNGMNVFVAPSGYIKGSIKARTLVIAGKVHGNVEAYSLVIHSSGELVYNKLVYRELLVEEGGVMICANDAADAHGMPAISRAPASAVSETNMPNSQPLPQPVIHKSTAEETQPQTPDMEETPPGIPAVGETPARVPVVKELPQTYTAPQASVPIPQASSFPATSHTTASSKEVHFHSSF